MNESFDGSAGRSSASPAGAPGSFLFLQGPIGPFFRQLAQRLSRSGHGVCRINFNGGDRLYWSGGPAVDFRGGAAQWPQFFERQLEHWSVSDIVLFGDCRPLHQAAVRIARLRGITVHVFEEGYLRPNWLTLETGGVNRNSSLPREPGRYLEAARQLPAWHPGIAVSQDFAYRAATDVLYNLANLLLRWYYPAYRSHKPWHPLAEYRAGAKRFFSRSAATRRGAALTESIVAAKRPYYLFPLQLEADAQIRFHSHFGSMEPAIREVIGSFARHAPQEAILAVTEHPLDWGVFDLGELTRRHAREAGVAERVVFMQGGSPEPLVRNSRGVVTVNSTIGFLAMTFGVPVKPLGHAVYDLPGLSFQPSLDRFWLEAAAPDPELFDCFRRVVAAQAQINGGLYSPAALTLAADNAALRLGGAVQARSAVAPLAGRSGPRRAPPALVTERVFAVPLESAE
jgi:capsular polysaccharide export protein